MVLQHRERNWTVFGGTQPNHTFECFWNASYLPEKKSCQHREMSWAVFGGARPSVDSNVVESLHNIRTKWVFNAAKRAGRWQGMLGSAALPQTWIILHGCETIRRKRSLAPWQALGRVWGTQPSHNFDCFWKASYHPEEKILQNREVQLTVFGGARPSVHLNVVECLHNIKTKRFFNAAIWAAPWQGILGSAAQP